MLFAAILERKESMKHMLVAQLSSDIATVLRTSEIELHELRINREAALPLRISQMGSKWVALIPVTWATAMGYQPGQLVYLDITKRPDLMSKSDLAVSFSEASPAA